MKRRALLTRSPLLVAALVASLGGSLIAGLLVFFHSPSESLEADLAPGAPLVREMASGDRHLFLLAIDSGQFVETVVEQRGIDVVLDVRDPEGRQILTVDSPNADRGEERATWLAEPGGVFTLELRGGAGGSAASYAIRIATLSAATPADRQRAAAAQIFDLAERQRRQGGEAALRQARAAYSQAIEQWQLGADPRGEALAQHRLGQVLGQLGDATAELTAYERSLELYRVAGAQREQALLLTQIGQRVRQSGRPTQALAAFEQAFELFAALGDDLRQARILTSMVRVLGEMGEIQRALLTGEQALERWQSLGDKTQQANTLNEIAETYVGSGQLPIALDYLQRAAELQRGAGDTAGEVVTLTNLGTIQRRQGQLEPARRCFEQALSAVRRLGDPSNEAGVLLGLGLTQLKNDERAAALASFEHALALALETGSRRTEAFALVNLGWWHLLADDPEPASPRLHAALMIFRELGERGGEASALFGLARVERLLGHLAAAQSWVERALERIEALRAGTFDTSLQVSFFAAKRDYFEFLIDLLMQRDAIEPAAGHTGTAFEASERGRARSLLDSLIEARADLRRDVDPALLEREHALQQALEAKELERLHRASNPAVEASLEDGLERDLRALVAELRTLRAQLRMQSPQFAALARPQPPSLAQVQELLDDDTLLLEYALGEQRSFLWLVSRRGLASRELPGRQRIEALARQAHELMTQSRKQAASSQTQVLLTALSEMVLGPVAELLGEHRLLVVSDGALQYVPFAALPVPGRNQQPRPAPLVVEHEIIGLPSAGVLALLHEPDHNRPPPPRTLAVLADPVFELSDPRLETSSSDTAQRPATGASSRWVPDGVVRLPFSHVEADAILALVAPDERLAALGFDANLETVRSGELARYRILHFATHGWLDTEHPELSGIVLSLFDERGRPRDGFLRAGEIYQLDLPAELVVLSACRTALGPEARGEGLIGLTRGFMYAGARQVVVSLWNVDDRATTELMQIFYHGLLGQRLPPAAALRAAQVALWRSKRWSPPYYWAGFVLQGAPPSKN